MPQLIRLSTTDPNAVWDSSFREDIIIPADAEIACYSVSTQINPTTLSLDGQNNEILYTVNGNDNIRSIFMNEGTYRSDNIELLMTDMTYKLNSSMENNSLELGKQWLVSTQGRFFNIACQRGQVSDMVLNAGLNGSVDVTVDDNGPLIGKVMYRSDPTTDTNDSFFWVKSPVTKGASSMRAQLYAAGTPDDETFFYGVSLTMPNSNMTEIDIKDIVFGIAYVAASGTNAFYGLIENGNIVASTVAVDYGGEGSFENDVLAIDFANNKIVARCYRGDNTVVEIGEYNGPYNHTTNLFPLWCFKGDSKWAFIQTSTDPWYNLNNKYTPTPAPRVPALTIFPWMTSNQFPSNQFLQFADPFISNFFGFESARMPVTGFYLKDNISYQAITGFGLKDYSESYIVQLLNLTLPQSYDSATGGGQRVNFLDVIPQYSITRERLVYQSSQPIYLRLKNQNAMNVRQLKARLLQEDLTAPSVYGNSQLTLLIRKHGEY
jgi:hypothetical protein